MRLKRFKTVTLLLNEFTHSSPHYVKPLLKEHIYAKQKGTTVPFKITQNEARDLSLADEHAFNLAWLFLMMGTFHILLMFLGMIGARFTDAGMRDVYIQSEIVAKRLIDSMLRGKHSNREIRPHKLSWKALYCSPSFSFYKQSIFGPRPEKYLSFSKKIAPRNCLAIV